MNAEGDDEKLCCMIALGYGDDPGRNMKRKGIKNYGKAINKKEIEAVKNGRANESKAKLALSFAECSRPSIIINGHK